MGGGGVQVFATPHSLGMLGQEDSRVPANLVDGVYGSQDGTHAWLAPFAASLPPDAGKVREGSWGGVQNVTS
jgi:hypothetical protein